MRQGNVHPLSVATGLYGRPSLGTSGGCIVAVFMVGASGTAAWATRLTAPAPSAAAEAPRKFLRFVMLAP